MFCIRATDYVYGLVKDEAEVGMIDVLVLMRPPPPPLVFPCAVVDDAGGAIAVIVLSYFYSN